MKKRVALFGGSFNPIHIGHLALANFICENDFVDELWFLITPENPLKQNEELLNEHQRLEMVQLATKEYRRFVASEFEFTLSRPSYSINTLKSLQIKYPEYQFFWVLGADNWLSFNKWKDYQLILDQFNLLIYPRLGYQVDIESLPNNVQYVDSPMIEVSSTFIRANIKEGKDICYFMHPKVYQYIKQHALYK